MLPRHKVYEAPDGEHALRRVETNPEIEVLVTDIRMPGLDGPGLVNRALELRSEMKVIFVTGYATYRSAAWPTLRKPFDLDEPRGCGAPSLDAAWSCTGIELVALSRTVGGSLFRRGPGWHHLFGLERPQADWK